MTLSRRASALRAMILAPLLAVALPSEEGEWAAASASACESIAAPTLAAAHSPSSRRWSFDARALALTSPTEDRFSLAPTLRVDLRDGLQSPSDKRRALSLVELEAGAPITRTAADGTHQVMFVARDERVTATFVYLLSPTNAQILELSVTLLYHRDVSVAAEELTFSFEDATITGYDHALEPVMLGKKVKQLHVPNHTPRHLEVKSGEHRLMLDASGAAGVMASVRGKEAKVTLELDHRAHHPFKIYDGCPDPKGLPTRWMDETPRVAGEQVTYRLLFWPEKSLEHLRPERYPEGYASAIAFTDHADQGTAARTRAFAYGAEDAGPGSKKGWVGRGLSYTKSVFAVESKGYAPQLDDPAFEELYREMIADGVEPGLHSVTGVTDSRALDAREIPAFGKRYPGAAWIDHGPERNCEAITNHGWDATSEEYFLIDLLLRAGIEVWWAVLDIPVKGSRLDMLAESPEKRRAVIWPQERLRVGASVPLLFASAWFFQARSTFLRRFSEKNLQRLAKDRGLLLAHTYLDVWATSEKFAKRTLLERRDGKIKLRDEADEVFANIETFQQKHLVLTEGVARLAPHLHDALRLRITPSPTEDNTYLITHTRGRPLEGVTFLVPSAAASEIRLDDKAIENRRASIDGEGVWVWFDLAPGQTRRLKISGDASSKASIVMATSGKDIP